jgi:hypothetical protein
MSYATPTSLAPGPHYYYCVVTNAKGGGTNTAIAGGFSGSFAGGTVTNSAALNQNINGASYSFGRVAGSGTINNSYGRGDMKKDGAAATWINNTSSASDGEDITAADWSSKSWWTGTVGFSVADWDFSGISATREPTLKNMQGGTQNPVIQ